MQTIFPLLNKCFLSAHHEILETYFLGFIDTVEWAEQKCIEQLFWILSYSEEMLGVLI